MGLPLAGDMRSKSICRVMDSKKTANPEHVPDQHAWIKGTSQWGAFINARLNKVQAVFSFENDLQRHKRHKLCCYIRCTYCFTSRRVSLRKVLGGLLFSQVQKSCPKSPLNDVRMTSHSSLFITNSTLNGECAKGFQKTSVSRQGTDEPLL